MLGIDPGRERRSFPLELREQLGIGALEPFGGIRRPRRSLPDPYAELVGDLAQRDVLVVERLAAGVELRIAHWNAPRPPSDSAPRLDSPHVDPCPGKAVGRGEA